MIKRDYIKEVLTCASDVTSVEHKILLLQPLYELLSALSISLISKYSSLHNVYLVLGYYLSMQIIYVAVGVYPSYAGFNNKYLHVKKFYPIFYFMIMYS